MLIYVCVCISQTFSVVSLRYTERVRHFCDAEIKRKRRKFSVKSGQSITHIIRTRPEEEEVYVSGKRW
jgi:hypothetical protein